MSEIKNWYAGKNVLVTGATGLVGKVLVERLLRECDDVNCIYLIVRAKTNFDARCQELLNHIAFDYVRASRPKQLEKIKIFQGDLTQHNLGLSHQNLTEILQNTDIIMHSSADVRFDVPLRDIYNTNAIGTYRFMELAKQIIKLQVFVFVSTTYSQSHHRVTEERHYAAEMDAFVLMKAFDRFDDQIMSALQAKILKEFPNTYSFSKHLAEHIVHQYRDQIPICVVRPSIICSAMTHPMPYYTEGLNGFNGWSFASARGVLRTSYLDYDAPMQLIPVDVVANTIIATSWIHGTKKLDHIDYYNVNMTVENFTVWNCTHTGRHVHFSYPLNYALWSPNSTHTKCAYYYYVRTFFYQILPSALLDLLIWISGRKPIMLKVQRKVYYGLFLIMPYFKNMKFETKKFIRIRNYLNALDRVSFNTDVDHMTADSITMLQLRGIRKFIANEKDEDLPRARKNNLMYVGIPYM